MKLHYKINLTSLCILIIVSSAIVLAGATALTRISYDLNRKLMMKEINSLRTDIQSAAEVLRQSGVAGVESYLQRAQKDVLADFAKYTFGEGGGKLVIVRKSDSVPLINAPTDSADLEFLKTISQQGTGSIKHKFEGETRFFCFSSYEEWGWVLALSESSEKLLEVRRRFLASVLAIMVISIAVGSFYLIWSTSRIVRPVRQLARTADEISHGNWDATFPSVQGSDEISQLTNSFREMSANLSATYKDLNEHLVTVKKSQDELSTEKERLAVTLRSIGDGVISTDIKGRITLLNKVAEDLTGWEQASALGQPLHEVFCIREEKGSTNSTCKAILDLTQTADREDFTSQARLISRNKLERIISISGSPIFDARSEALGVILVFRDITDSVKMQEELIKAYKLESVGVLAGGIAHDFNNLLTGILGNISLAKLITDKNEPVFTKLESAEKASLRAKDLTKQLLTFSKGGEPVKKLVSLRKVIEESASFALAGSNCRCEYDIAEDLWSVEADDGQISQVLHNLLINASQAMPEGGSILVFSENVVVDEFEGVLLKPGNYIKITVKDHGCGIEEGSLKQIFDPYYTTKEGGSGLGLASAYSIVKKHEGLIRAESAIGEGSVFTIYLPASDLQARKTVGHEKQLTMGAGKVLVVDDEEIVKDVTGMMLASLGYGVDFADDGESAVDKYKQRLAEGRRYDLVIMDLTIPGGMGGKEAIQKLREIDPEISAIVSSGYANDPIMANFQDYGFSAVISKPFNIDELSKTLASLQ